MTVTVDLIDSGALDLLRDMERRKLIRVNRANPPEKTRPAPEGGLAERFAGALHLSDERYAEFEKALREGRDEWERDIY
jgi:hypothetical protein